jgi:2-iminobutanoate/2-iminopropanoate deaminase
MNGNGANGGKAMAKREELSLAGMAPPISHYCDAVRFGDLLFISGMVGVDERGRVVGEGDAARQTRQIFENMKKVLDAAGAGFSDVLKVTVFLTDIDDRARINPVRQEFFGTARPASTLVEVSKLVRPDLLVEIEAVVGLPRR